MAKSSDNPPNEKAVEAAKLGCASFVLALGVAVLFGRVNGSSASSTMLFGALAIGLVAGIASYLRTPKPKEPKE